MTTQTIRRLYRINISNDRLFNYLDTHARAFIIIPGRGIRNSITSEYLQTMFVELNAYCKLDNSPREQDILFQCREEEWLFF